MTISPAPRRVGIIGGTFDPMHRGHIDLGHAAETALGLMRLFVIPAHVPPHRPQPAASSFHRFTMAAMTVSGRPGWRVSDIELRQVSTSYTSTTLGLFHQRGYEPRELFFIIGADAFKEISTWHAYPQVLDAAHFAVVSRPGHPVGELPGLLPHLSSRMAVVPAARQDAGSPLIILIEATTAHVSSTAIRELRVAGEPITGLVDLRVQQHIEQHGLYTPMQPGRRGSDHAAPPAASGLHGQS